MDLETAQTATTAKLPILKQGPVTTEEKVQKKNDAKARSMLLMALPNEHLMTFNQYKDAKTLFAAIQTRFGGNEATKKTQKTLLKQMYENFSDLSTESLDSIFNRLQKIVSQLAILGENVSQGDLNLKFLRSLPSEWNTHVVVWRNKPDLDTMSFDDLYNNFKIVEQEVKGTASSSSSSISTASTQVSTTSTQVSTANLSDATVYAFLANQPNGSQLVHEDLEQIHEDDLEEMDLKWQLALLSMRTRKESRGTRNQDSRSRNQDSSRRTINVEETSSKAMLAIDGAVFDWSYMADDEVPTNIALMAFLDSEFNISEFNLANYKRGLASVEEQLVFYKKNKVIFCEQLVVLKRDISYKDSEISTLKSKLEKLKQEKESNQLKIENFNNTSKSLDKLIGSQIPDKSRKGLGFVSYNVVPPPPTELFSPLNLDLSNSGLKEFQQPEFEGYGPKTSKNVSKDTSNEVRESPDAPMVEKLVSNDKLKKKNVFPTVAKIEFVRPKQQEKPVRKPVKYAKIYRSQGPSFNHVQANCNYHQKERVVSGNNYTRVNYNYSAKKVHPSAHRNIVPRAVLMKISLRPLNTVTPINTAHPKTTVYSVRPMSCFSKSEQSTLKRPYQTRTTLTNQNFSQKVNTAKGNFYTARQKAVNTARQNSAVVNAIRANQEADPRSTTKKKIKVILTVDAQASACWVWRPTKLNSASITLKRHNYVDAGGISKVNHKKKDQGYIDSGCSRHMTGKMSYLSDFKEYDGGYVTFGGGAKGEKTTGKGTLKTGKLDFEDVYFVKELQFNLFSVLQMCDKKNSVLFTNTACFVLSSDFKLTDESQVLLKVLRKNNMYSVDMKNIVPKESFACLVANATLDESMLWHRRLGKVTQSLLFTWVFFLASKDETSCILKSFIIEIENLVDKKVKIMRCDNRTEFKNRVMSEFCEKKGIKKEFSVARTPQQNGVAKRRNMTNMVLVVKPHNKTPYELFRGRTHALSFMRLFGCHVTILNTLDHLGKFDGKSDEGFFVGYLMNSDGPKWLFDIDVLTKSMNYVPVVVGTNSNDLVGTEEIIGASHSSKEIGSSQDYILMPLWKDGSLFNSSSNNASNHEPQPSSDAGKKDDEGVNNESGIDDQERSRNIPKDVNTARPIITAPLEATHADFFGDETEVDMSNITTTYPVPSTLNTRIHKDHSLDHVIGDVQSGVQTRRMIRTTNEQGFISVVYKEKTHEDLQNCLFAYFLSQVEPKKVIQALTDSS
ncbi:putative ribonuclease H-like domain-containing protein [Tanacetum coccineum]